MGLSNKKKEIIIFMARSKYKNFYYPASIWKKLFKVKINKIIPGRLVFTRASAVPRLLAGSRYFIYNGNGFNKVFIGEEIWGKKFGEFSQPRKPFFYPKKDKKKR